MKRRVRERVVGVSAEDDVEAVDEVGRELIVVCHWPSSQAPAKFEPPHMSHTCHIPDLPFLFILILIFIMFFFLLLSRRKKEGEWTRYQIVPFCCHVGCGGAAGRGGDLKAALRCATGDLHLTTLTLN